MDDVKVREKLREAFRTFSLPRMMPGAIPVPKPEGFEAITINGGRGRLCSVCGEIVPSDAEGSFQSRTPMAACSPSMIGASKLWQEERNEVRRR